MKEYIVKTDEEELYYNSFDYYELIHCKECACYTPFYSNDGTPYPFGFCGRHPHKLSVYDSDYCSFMVRKKEAENEHE